LRQIRSRRGLFETGTRRYRCHELTSSQRLVDQPAELRALYMLSELSASDNYGAPESHTGDYHGAAEWPATSRLGMGADSSQTSVNPYQSQSSEESNDEPPSHSSPAPTPYVQQPYSTPEAITALEAEERRIDGEMEEVRRMKEL
jgi:hypothetical protein